jgi:hypothetical protein
MKSVANNQVQSNSTPNDVSLEHLFPILQKNYQG